MDHRISPSRPPHPGRPDRVRALHGCPPAPVETRHSPDSEPTIARLDSPSITPDMLVPLLIMIVGFTVYFAWVVIVWLQGEVLERERSARWVQQLAAGGAE